MKTNTHGSSKPYTFYTEAEIFDALSKALLEPIGQRYLLGITDQRGDKWWYSEALPRWVATKQHATNMSYQGALQLKAYCQKTPAFLRDILTDTVGDVADSITILECEANQDGS